MDSKLEFWKSQNLSAKLPPCQLHRKEPSMPNSVADLLRNKVLSESWEARGFNNKRLLLDPASDAHLSQEHESFLVFHMAGFDLMRDSQGFRNYILYHLDFQI